MRRYRAAGLLFLGLGATLASDCGNHRAAPSAPMANLPPEVLATSPPARSVHIPTDVVIWAQFDRALDPSTVDTRHVSLRVDTRRLPITVSYDAATQRVLINAGGNLALRVTHTVEFMPGLRTADGDSLGQSFFWQFTTISVRRPTAPYPADGATEESPFTELFWQGTESSAGSIAYDLFAGADSGAVAARNVVLTRVTATDYIPRQRWPQDTPDYWSIRATNLDTGESSEGPVWRFDPLPSSTPIDSSAVIHMSHWLFGTQNGFPQCDGSEIVVGGIYDNLERWDLSMVGPGTRLAGAALTASSNFPDGSAHGLTVASVLSAGTLCTLGATSPYDLPVADADMAGASLLPGGGFEFQSDALAAYVESVVRHGATDVTKFRAGSQVRLRIDAVITLYIYRPPAPALGARR